MNLSDEIQQCGKCIDLGLVDAGRLNTSKKPYVQFGVERLWKPGRVDVLFVAESPPWNGRQRYFYNLAGNQAGLRKEILKHLGLGSLQEFRDRKNYFLIDTIKCRLSKSKKNRTPLNINKVSRTCANQFLRREIIELKPKTIFVLGNTAKKALQTFCEFKELRKHKVTEEYDENLSGYRVILCVYPGGQTRKYREKTNRAFSKIR